MKLNKIASLSALLLSFGPLSNIAQSASINIKCLLSKSGALPTIEKSTGHKNYQIVQISINRKKASVELIRPLKFKKHQRYVYKMNSTQNIQFDHDSLYIEWSPNRLLELEKNSKGNFNGILQWNEHSQVKLKCFSPAVN